MALALDQVLLLDLVEGCAQGVAGDAQDRRQPFLGQAGARSQEARDHAAAQHLGSARDRAPTLVLRVHRIAHRREHGHVGQRRLALDGHELIVPVGARMTSRVMT